MPTSEHRSLIPAPASALWAFHASPGALARLTPPWLSVLVERASVGIHVGAEVLMRVPLAGPVRAVWLARHVLHEPPHRFADTMVLGPMARWTHTHEIRPIDAASSELIDRIDYTLPGGALGALFGGGFVARDLARVFAFRHRRTAHDIRRHATFANHPRLRIVISGASGLIGRLLIAYLVNAGHTVDRLVRHAPRPTGDGTPHLPGREFFWNPVRQIIDPAVLEGADAVIHLGGVNLAQQRWTPRFEREILTSRRDPTSLLSRTLASLSRPPGVFVVASGVAGYPATPGDAPASTESTPLSRSFLANVIRAWESACEPALQARIRVVNLRLGPVVCAQGGFLLELARVVRWGLLRRLGNGSQVMPWVGVDDALAAFEHALHTPTLRGPVNVVAPVRATHDQVLAAIARAVNRPRLFSVPEGLVRLLAGGLSEELVVSRAVVPRALLDSGFTFTHSDIATAVCAEMGLPHSGLR